MTRPTGSTTMRFALISAALLLGGAILWLTMASDAPRSRSELLDTAAAGDATPSDSLACSSIAADDASQRSHAIEPADSTPDAAASLVAGAAEAKPHAGCRIHGVVREASGAALPKLVVWLTAAAPDASVRFLDSFEVPEQEVVSDERGAFEFQGVAPGLWLVAPGPAYRRGAESAEEDRVAPLAVLVDVEDDDVEKEVEIRAHRGLWISGRVERPDGTPATGGYVAARTELATGWTFAPVRNDGTYRIGPLAAGPYDVFAEGDVVGTTSASYYAFAGDRDVVLRLREGGSIAGRVIDGRSDGGGKVAIHAERQDVEPHQSLSAEIGAGGVFEIDNVAPGRYQLVARTEDAWFALRSSVDVVAGRREGDVALELREGGRLRVLQAAGATARIEIRQGDVRIVAIDLREPDSMLSVPPGGVTVRWTVGRRSTGEKSLAIAAGTVHELELPE